MTPIPDFIPLTPLPVSPDGYRGLATDRVLRHFAVTCAERVPIGNLNREARDRLLVACRCHADGIITDSRLRYERDDCYQDDPVSDWAAAEIAGHAADRASAWAAYRISDGGKWEETKNQSRLLTLHISEGDHRSTWENKSVPAPRWRNDWHAESIAVARWSPEWRTYETANLAEQIAAGDLSLAPILGDLLNDLGCDNQVWLRILRECPEIIRPGMWFWDRLRGIQERVQDVSVPSVRVATSEGIVVRPGRLITGTV